MDATEPAYLVHFAAYHSAARTGQTQMCYYLKPHFQYSYLGQSEKSSLVLEKSQPQAAEHYIFKNLHDIMLIKGDI